MVAHLTLVKPSNDATTKQREVYKRFQTEDEALILHTALKLKKNGTYDTVVNLEEQLDDGETGAMTTIAIDVDGLDELIAMLVAAKRVIVEAEAGSAITNDPEPE